MPRVTGMLTFDRLILRPKGHPWAQIDDDLERFTRRCMTSLRFAAGEGAPRRSRDHGSDPLGQHMLSMTQVAQRMRMRVPTVRNAMVAGHLPYEERDGRRYSRLTDVQRWEESRLKRPVVVSDRVHPSLADLA
ncbi:MAG: hypothetical protein WD042_05845 [Phycisphaeraceae bacterium]